MPNPNTPANRGKAYKSLRTRFETAERFQDRGSTAEASQQVAFTIAETLVEILAALEEIAMLLEKMAGAPSQAAPKPVTKGK